VSLSHRGGENGGGDPLFSQLEVLGSLVSSPLCVPSTIQRLWSFTYGALQIWLLLLLLLLLLPLGSM